jgi:tetratricopeptide (TPR) repeat protein
MIADKIFVGRKAELEQFKKVLEDPRGQAILVVGHRGMGKTWLINKMAELAQNHPNLKCGCVRYEVTPTDSVGSTMALMMDDAYEAGRSLKEGIKITGRNKEMWKALFAAAQVLPVVGSKVKGIKELGELILSLHREPARDTRAQFLGALNHMSKRMKDEARAILIIDPEKYMQEKSASDWRIVVKQLPPKVKLIFAQRTEDELVKSKAFMALENVKLIPENHLGQLAEDDVRDLVRLRARDVGLSGNVLRDAVGRYEGHPYAVQAALDIVKKTKNVGELLQDPTPEAVAETQWDEVCKVGPDAISLFEAYAILEVGVPDDVVDAVSGLTSAARKRLNKDSYLRGLLREEGYGKRVYHAILADYILDQINITEKKEYHNRAIKVYGKKLKLSEEAQTIPDALAAMRLAEHVLEAKGQHAFVIVFVHQCWPSLLKLGLLDIAYSLCNEALRVVSKGSHYEAMGTCILGEIHRFRGNLKTSEDLYRRSLDISRKLEFAEGMANAYGNLGLTYRMCGQLDKAEKMHLRSLEIEKKLGRISGIATDCGNLGLIYSTLGEWEKAEEMHVRSLEIAEEIGDFGEIANQCNNLGLIYEQRGELEKAEQIQKRSLDIEKKIGRLDGIANSYGNIGLIQIKRRKLDEAKENIDKSLSLYEQLGDPEGLARQYGNLGTLFMVRDELDLARELLETSLAMSKVHGFWETIAKSYINLGTISQRGGDVQKARKYWDEALGLYEKVGVLYMVKKIQGWLDKLEEK